MLVIKRRLIGIFLILMLLPFPAIVRAFGKPIVASNLDVFKEIFTDDEIAMFDLKDKKSVATAIKRVLQDKETLSCNIKLKYEKAYSPDCFYRRYLEIYNNLLAEQ